MNLSVGIIGLPNVGKSTLFNALMGRQVADVAEYPFCTIEPNVGVVEVPDKRLERLRGMSGGDSSLADSPTSEESLRATVRGVSSASLRTNGLRMVPAAIRFVDIAGLVKGAHKGEGLGNQFLAHIREVDVICHVVRDFEAPSVARAGGSSEPKSDIELVNTELVLKDLETVEKALSKITRAERLVKDKKTEARLSAFEKLKTGLSEDKLAKGINLTEKEEEAARELFLLTAKPMIYVKNVSEASLPTFRHSEAEGRRISGGSFADAQDDKVQREWIMISAKLEAELAELSPEERQEYLKEFGIKESGLDQLIKSCYKLLDLITFFTIEGGKQVQAWPMKKGSTAIEAAGMVHSDFAEKFIRAEVIGFEQLIEAESWEKAKEKGWVRTEGKGYVVKDGDVVAFKI